MMERRLDKNRLLFCTVACLAMLHFAAGFAPGAEWPQWRGPERTGISTESDFLTTFPEGGPTVLWKKSLGPGCSTVAIAGNRLLTTGNVNNQEIVYCFHPETGDELWRFAYDCPLDAKNFEGGSGTTPTLDGEVLFTLSRQGHFHCLATATGKPVWSRHAESDWGGKKPTWGFSGSALVVGERVIVPADVVVALNKKDGSEVWKTERIGAAYSSPYRFSLEGRDCLAIACAVGLVVLDTNTGAEILRYPWKTSYDCNIATPIVSGDEVYISAGYNHGCAKLRVADATPVLVWENKVMRNHFNSSVLWEGHLYGFDDQDLRCQSWQTGESVWGQRGFGKGSLMIAGGTLIVLGERGKLAIAKADPAGWKPTAEAQVLQDRCWVVPVLCNGLLYAKNNLGEMVCLDLRKKP